MRLIPTGGRYGNGRIVMTKNLESDTSVADFLIDLLGAIRFPGEVRLDAHGFVQSKEGEPVFVFGSPNSGIQFWNEKQSVLLRR